MSRRNLTVLFAGLAIGLLCYLRAERNPYARYTSGAYQMVNELSLEDPDDSELFAGAVRGMVSVLRARGDVHSGYLAPNSAAPLRAEMRQEFGGIGVRIGMEGDPPEVVVVEPPQPGTPAYSSPIRGRDVIVAVDGQPLAGRGLDDVLAVMRGPVGAALELTVRRPDASEETFRLVREVIRVPSVIGDRRGSDGEWQFQLAEDPRIALVRITTFGNRTVEELTETLDELTSAGAEAFVLDVRQNAGGALDAAIGVAELFLPEGVPVVSTRGRDGQVLDEYRTPENGPYLDPPLAVLVDGDTASASEIVAAALQDHQRAVVIGERSFGKGTVQQLLPLEAGRSLLKLTSASYWRPSGVNIHRSPGTADDAPWGVSPLEADETPLSDKQREAWYAWRRQRDLVAADDGQRDDAPQSAGDPLEADPALRLALERLRSQLGGG